MDAKTKKEIFKNLEKTKKGIPLSHRAKDAWTKGFCLHPCYREDWDKVSEIFNDYCIDMSHQGPIITKQTTEEVLLAKRITDQLINDKKIRKMALKVSYPLRNVYPNPKMSEDQLIGGTIFIIVLRLIPSFCIKIGMDKLKQFIDNGSKYEIFDSLFEQHGTIKDTQKGFEDAVRKMIEKLK